MIIGICGLMGSGKDTIANHLIQKHQFKKISFARFLKRYLDCSKQNANTA